jgi:hypothetical protein
MDIISPDPSPSRHRDSLRSVPVLLEGAPTLVLQPSLSIDDVVPVNIPRGSHVRPLPSVWAQRARRRKLDETLRLWDRFLVHSLEC